MWHNIPTELRERAQWVCAGPNKVPLNPRTGQAASVTDPATWATFEEAIHSGYRYIGFVLTSADPYTIIDLDNKPDHPCTPEQWSRHQKILEAFNSYTERSASGSGYHIIVRGNIPAGVKRDNVEAYSTQRYMICTGDVVRQVPIADYQQLLDILYGEMRPAATVELDEVEGSLTDCEVVDMAMRAVNGNKFDQLCIGDWAAMGYPSQSEADFALLSIFAYYTMSNEQVRRLFRMSGLGKRDKAQRNDYLNRCLAKIRANQPGPVDLGAIASQAQSMVCGCQCHDKTYGCGATTCSTCCSSQKSPPPTVTPAPVAPAPVQNSQPVLPRITLPPGLVGEMASYFYQTSVRPVPEVSLAAAIALTAGVCGRSYNVSNTGLNQYLILIAKTGSGKEGAVTGIDNLVAAVRPSIPMVDQFVGPSAFASGQALIKVLDERPCFVSVLGEFGLTLQQLCSPMASSPQIMLRKVLLDLYTKSGWSKVLRSSVYSDVEKNTKVVQAPNVTVLGESTPETFFDGLDASHISEGLIPRFSIVEYAGDRPPRNLAANTPPSAGLVQRFGELVVIALTTQNNNTCCAVQIEPAALAILDEMDRRADALINAARQDVEMQLWNRAHLKSLKMAALLAVGVNPHQPIVTPELATWACDFVTRDVETMSTRYKTGDVGTGDAKLHNDVKRAIEAYFKLNAEQASNYGVLPQMHKDSAIPYVYLQRRTANLTSFRDDRRGASGALRSVLTDLLDGGQLVELPLGQAQERYKTRGKVYGIGPQWVKSKVLGV